ncbi:MAG: IS630 family transposase [Gammaproteobacteria bacterium]|nr:IS630 family transposase [Gammaproteobacteria bacterium]
MEIPPAAQARMLAELRRARYGYWLALHLLLLCAAGRTPSEIAAVLFCSRSTVYRVVRAYRAGDSEWLEEEGAGSPLARRTGLSPALRRSVLAILKAAPRACGWCRTRWSCATVALEVRARRGVVVSAETVRRWLHALGWEWKRAKLVAKDDDPQRVEKLARIRYAFEQLRAGMALFFADELDIALLPKVGYQWMPKGEQVEVPTPGTNEKRYLAGALDIATGTTPHCVWYRKTTGLFLDRLATLDRAYPAPAFSCLSVVVDNSKIHYAGEVQTWLAAHPRFALLYLPTYCPKANPIERAFGDVHDKCTRNHTRKRMWHLVRDVEQHLAVNGPWAYALSDLYYTPEVTAAVQALWAAATPQEETSQLAA